MNYREMKSAVNNLSHILVTGRDVYYKDDVDKLLKDIMSEVQVMVSVLDHEVITWSDRNS